MRALFVHTADNHLGYEQYGVKERFNDFSRAFWAIIDDAIARKADLFIIAGGAGLLLAAALLIPGNRPRSEALRENGRRAIRLVAASTVLLLIAGTLEGFVSPIETWPLAWKLAVSAATAVFLVVYLSGGRTTRTVGPVTGEHPAAPEMLGLRVSA